MFYFFLYLNLLSTPCLRIRHVCQQYLQYVDDASRLAPSAPAAHLFFPSPSKANLFKVFECSLHPFPPPPPPPFSFYNGLIQFFNSSGNYSVYSGGQKKLLRFPFLLVRYLVLPLLQVWPLFSARRKVSSLESSSSPPSYPFIKIPRLICLPTEREIERAG